MAIAFEPRQAFDAQVARSYGASQARMQDRDFQLRAAALAQQGAIRSAELAQSGAQFEAAQKQQVLLEGMRESNQANMQQSAQGHQAGMQQMRIDAEFTQADNLRLQRLNQDAAGWEALHLSGDIDDQEYAAGQQMIQRGTRPLEARREATEQRRMQQQNRLIMQQEAATAARARMTNEYMTANGPIFREDPESGLRFYQDTPGGNWQVVPAEGAGGSGSRSSSGGQVNTIIHDVDNSMKEDMKRDATDTRPLPEWARPDASPELRQQERQRRFEERMDLHAASQPPNRRSVPVLNAIAQEFNTLEERVRQTGGRLGVAGAPQGREAVDRAVGRLRSIRTQLENTVSLYPDRATMPLMAQRRFDRLRNELAELIQPRAAMVAAPGAVRVPPAGAPRGGRGRTYTPEELIDPADANRPFSEVLGRLVNRDDEE